MNELSYHRDDVFWKGELRIMRPLAQMLSMNTRRVLITGTASGIGKALALRFAEAGADLILLDIDEAGLAQTAEDISGLCSTVRRQMIDLTHKAQIDAFWDRFDADLPDTLINNAGCYPTRDYLE